MALLLAVILCVSQASAVNIVHEEDYEVVPDYSQMDTETAFTTYLRREMKLNPAAVCGILANIEYESDFSPTVWGDDGTSYGLCQWHESRCRSLFLFCQENGYCTRNADGAPWEFAIYPARYRLHREDGGPRRVLTAVGE